MKVLFCDNSLRELLNFRKNVIDSYVENGWDVVLVAPRNCDYMPESSRIKVIPISELQRSGKNPFQDLNYFCALRKIYRTERPDYIFHYTIKPNIYGTLAAKSCGIHSSAMVAGLGYVFNKSGMGNKIARSLYKFALRFADYVFVLNAYNYEYLKDKFVSRKKLILLKGGEGVDLRHFFFVGTGSRQEEIKFLMISRVLYDKGYQEYVDTAKSIRKMHPEAEFQLLGSIDGAYPNHVPEEQVRKDVEAGYIRYLGYHSNVRFDIEEADCIVLPSYHEGLSRVLMEALAMGKPIITTDIPGCRETVDISKNGFLVKPKDTKSLMDAIIKFLALTEDKKHAMGRYSREKAEREFDVLDVVKMYHQITNNIIANKD